MTRGAEKFERSTAGLRDALMAEMEDVRAGIASSDEAFAFAKLAEKIIESLDAEIRMKAHEQKVLDIEYRRLQEEKRAQLPPPVEREEEEENYDDQMV
jgi:hypothetical protein